MKKMNLLCLLLFLVTMIGCKEPIERELFVLDVRIFEYVVKSGKSGFVAEICSKDAGKHVCITDIKEFAKNSVEIGIPAKISTDDGILPVKEVGASAFQGCSALKVLSIPKSVVKIGESAFDGCGSLEKIEYGGSAEDMSQIEGIGDCGLDDGILVGCNGGEVDIADVVPSDDPQGGDDDPQGGDDDPQGGENDGTWDYSKVYEITSDADFDEKVTNSTGVVLVDFYRGRCFNCLSVGNSLGSICSDGTYGSDVKICKVQACGTNYPADNELDDVTDDKWNEYVNKIKTDLHYSGSTDKTIENYRAIDRFVWEYQYGRVPNAMSFYDTTKENRQIAYSKIPSGRSITYGGKLSTPYIVVYKDGVAQKGLYGEQKGGDYDGCPQWTEHIEALIDSVLND